MRWLIGAIFVPLASVAAAQRGDVADPPDPYVHAQTGMAFPARVGPAVRHQVVRYSDDGSDSGIGYQVPRGDGLVAYVSIFVYPAPALKDSSDPARSAACADVFDGMKRDVLAHEPAAKPIAEGAIAAPARVFNRPGLHIVYEGGTAKFDGAIRLVHEEARLFCYGGGKWLVSYRITAPAGVDATAEVDRLVAALPWPQTLAR